MTSNYRYRGIKRRDVRHTKVDDTHKPVAAKKDTKKWCGGKVGRAHKAVCMKRPEPHIREWRELVCTVCGKRLDTWYGPTLWWRPYEKPDWVDK